MPQFKLVDHLENGEVTLRVYEMEDGSRRWWLGAGVGLLEFTSETMTQLRDLIRAIDEENV